MTCSSTRYLAVATKSRFNPVDSADDLSMFEQRPGAQPASMNAGGPPIAVAALVEKFDTELLAQNFQANHQTLEGSFSVVSTPIFASKYSFCSVFRNLQDCHTFAPLEIQNLRKFSSNFFIFLLKFLQRSRFFSDFRRILHQFQ